MEPTANPTLSPTAPTKGPSANPTTAEPTAPTANPTLSPTVRNGTYHYIIGGANEGQQQMNNATLCTADHSNQAAIPNYFYNSYDIAVTCCALDGSFAARPSCSAHPATYNEAYQLCDDNGLRLCTIAELEADIAMGTGCYYGVYLNWVSDECNTPSPTFQPTGIPTKSPSAGPTNNPTTSPTGPNCYPQGSCDEGYMSRVTNPLYWDCGAHCVGGM